MNNQKFAKRTQEVLNNLGKEISLGHTYELLARLAGFKSWNEAKAKDADLTIPFKKDETHPSSQSENE